MTAKKNETVLDDIESILPDSTELFVDGVKCTVRRVKSREFFWLMGILTNGLGPAAAAATMQAVQEGGSDEDRESAFGARIVAGLITALPNQFDRFLQFCIAVVEPVEKRHAERIAKYLENPPVEDLLPIIDVVVEQEKDDVWMLLGKARAYLAKWKTTFQSVDRSQLRSI